MNKLLFVALLATFSFANQKLVFYVEGMHCPLCASMVRKALLNVDGVVSAKASLKDKKAFVEANDNVSEQVLKDAIATTGYSGVRVPE
ncbi:MAG: heavy-metal-associated domain-containing protein [Wolinella sp.]